MTIDDDILADIFIFVLEEVDVLFDDVVVVVVLDEFSLLWEEDDDADADVGSTLLFGTFVVK